jgi:phytoene dehydrogenase-like protein
VVVVGGGIAGIAAALILGTRGRKVTLLESNPQVGGLLLSRERGSWGEFDFGSHLFSETGLAELDALLFADQRGSTDWIAHPHAVQDIVFAGQRQCSPFFDTRLLPAATHDRAFAELKALQLSPGPHVHLGERILASYGPTLSEEVFRPVLQKFYGVPLEDLAEDAHLLFGLKRIIAGTPEETRALKHASPWHDDRIAYHEVAEGASPISHFYPKERGIGLWVEQAHARIEKVGVRIITGARTKRLHATEGHVTALELEDGTMLPCSQVIWSAPAFHLLKLAGLQPPPDVAPPRFRRVQMADLVLDQPLESSAHYITCYDPSLRTFRITNYAAMRGVPGQCPARVTMEVLGHEGPAATAESMLAELVSMRLVQPHARLLDSWISHIDPGFPILTPAYVKDVCALADTIHASLRNVMLAGRASGRVFFMKGVLTDVWRQLSPP